MVNRHKIQIPELTGEEERNLYIYLPDSYDWDRERYYPVLYMFDGHNVFFDSDATYGKCWGMKEYMDHTNTARTMDGSRSMLRSAFMTQDAAASQQRVRLRWTGWSTR